MPANDAIEIDVQMNGDASLMDHTRDATVAPTQTAPASPASVASLGTLNRHWLTEEAGYLTFRQSGNLKMRVPLYVAPYPAEFLLDEVSLSVNTAAAGGNASLMTIG